jgi:enoyl-CoA hydratase/carnithine racemase
MPDILSKQSGPILEITLNRPDRGNGADDAMALEITRLINEAPEGTKCIVLRGAGADFCTGRVAAGPPPTGPGNAFAVRGFFEAVFNCYGAIRNSPVPVIAVVQGRALGFGCAVAAVADITLASDQATFQVPEMAHNILPTMVMSSFVDRIPRKAFTYLVYSTAVISAERALSFGIVSDVVPADTLEDAVTQVTGAILKAPLPAVRGVKEYARHAFHMHTDSAVDFARNIHALMNSSAEMRRN